MFRYIENKFRSQIETSIKIYHFHTLLTIFPLHQWKCGRKTTWTCLTSKSEKFPAIYHNSFTSNLQVLEKVYNTGHCITV